MEHNRNHKILIIFALVFSIASLSVGFAAFSVSLNISSSASITPNSDTFGVKFSTDSYRVVESEVEPYYKSEGLVVSNGKINNKGNPTLTNLSAYFTKPGQYVEYSVNILNIGEYTAYLNNVNYLGNKTCVAEVGTNDLLVQSVCDSISVSIILPNYGVYNSTTLVTNAPLEKQSSTLLVIRISYENNGSIADGPFRVTFPSISLGYSSVDNSSIKPVVARLESGTLDEIGSIVSIGNEKFYVIGQEDENVKLLSMYNLYVGGEYKNGIWNEYGSVATGIQDVSMLGYVAGYSTRRGITAYSSESKKGTKYSDYSGSIVELYINNYADYLKDIGVAVSKARLITNDELLSLGCSYDDSTCRDAYEFVYSTTYWSGFVWDDENVGIVSTDKEYGYHSVVASKAVGVRPVIEIPLSEF